MSDSGGEYKSKEFDEILKKEGIKVLQSVPHTPQQNGHAERFNRTLMDKAQAIRLDACLPQSWWEFAVNCALHAYNRTPMRRLGWRTPYELVNGKVPDIGYFRVFGCGAYVYLPEDVRANKLAPKSELMVFLGYPEGIKGYLFMRLHNNSLFVGATALFDETFMPKCPTADRRGFTPISEQPIDDNGPTEAPPIPEEADDDSVDFPEHHQSPSPKRDLSNNKEIDPPSTPPRQQQQPPVEPPPAPWKSGRTRNVLTRPGNIYGDTRNPTDILNEGRRRALRPTTGSKGRSQPPDQLGQQQPVPGPSSA